MTIQNRSLLLISASKADDTPYLEHAKTWLSEHFGSRRVLFIPYAGVSISHRDYTQKVVGALTGTTFSIHGIDAATDPRQALIDAEAIAVGGGNTFVLLDTLYKLGLLDIMRRKLAAGTPYAGWSAGSNLAGRSIRTTNDMPIVQPRSFDALGVVPFQINPHYTDFVPAGFHGETRDQRIAEFNAYDPHTPVVAIQEGSALKVSGNQMQLLGHKPGYVFTQLRKYVLPGNSNCSQWL